MEKKPKSGLAIALLGGKPEAEDEAAEMDDGELGMACSDILDAVKEDSAEDLMEALRAAVHMINAEEMDSEE